MDTTSLATSLHIPEAHLRALLEVESGGEGLLDGRPIIRLEVHRLWRLAPEALRPRIDLHYHVGGPSPWEGHCYCERPGTPWVPLHQPGRAGQAMEWAAYDLARLIAGADVATRATSWGAAQILGDWRALGYPGPDALVAATYTAEGQLDLMGRFLRARPDLLASLRVGDWEDVARQYNGPGQVAGYSARLRAAIARSAP